MRAFRLIRFVILCIFVLALWERPGVVRAQGQPSNCQKFDVDLDCCGLNCNDTGTCIQDVIVDSSGPGTQSITLKNVQCTAAPGAPPGSCSSLSDAVAVTDASCEGGPGAPCNTDDDCHFGNVCQDGLCGPPVEDPPVD